MTFLYFLKDEEHLVFNETSPKLLLASSLVWRFAVWTVDRVDDHHPKLVQRSIIPDNDVASSDLVNRDQV